MRIEGQLGGGGGGGGGALQASSVMCITDSL